MASDKNSEESDEDLFHIEEGPKSRNKANIDSRPMESCSSQHNMFEDVDDSSREGKDEKPSKVEKKINFHPIPSVPSVAVPEKIVFCVDNSHDKGTGYSFKDLDSNYRHPHTIRNDAIRIFINNKLAIANDTQFAIVSVEPGKFNILTLFSSDVEHLMKSLTEFTSVPNEEIMKEYDITSVFSHVLSLISIPEQTNVKIIPPNYVLRIIFLYCNSYLEPQVNARDSAYVRFITSPYCIFDVFYLHEKQSEFNNVVNIFKSLGRIVSQNSYLMESSRSIINILNTMAKLLAHPYQRINEQLWTF